MPQKSRKPVVFISDLHADRWGRDRRESFFSFLDSIEKSAAELFVLGDIFDFPSAKNDSIWPRHQNLIMRLLALPGKGVPLTYIIGNHDISLRGIEWKQDGLVITYCDRKNPLERDLHGKKIYMDHGHFYDPLFQDHIYDAMDFLKTVTGQAVDRKAVDFLRDVVRIFQRKPKHGQPGKAEPMQEVGVPDNLLKIWEQAAEQILKRMRYDIVFFGHTHAPCIVEMKGHSQRQWYINTGDWVAHSTYVELTPGGIALKDWLSKTIVAEAAF